MSENILNNDNSSGDATENVEPKSPQQTGDKARGPQTLKGYACAWAYNGYHVLPLAPKSKVPRKGFEWKKQATDDPRVVESWFEEHPDSNVAIRTGKESGVVVLDIDPRNSEYATADDLVAKLEEMLGCPLPDTTVVRTGGGGYHIYFLYPDGEHVFQSEVIPGVEVKADGRYVVAPPSVHPNGNRYEWKNRMEPVEAPRPLLDLITKPHQPDERQARDRPPVQHANNRRVSMSDLLDWFDRQMEETDNRNELGFKFFHQALSNGYTPDELETCIPEVAHRLNERHPSDHRYEQSEAYKSLYSAAKGIENGEYPSEPWELDEDPTPIQRPTEFTAVELLAMDLPEPVFVVDDLLPEGLTILAGNPKIGKSWFVLALAVDIASGRKTLSIFDTKQGDVLYLALEDNPRRLQNRLRKVLKGNRAPQNLTIRTESPTLDNGGLEAISNWLDRHPDAKLVVIDTFAKVRGEENPTRSRYDNDYKALGDVKKLSEKHEVAIIVVHHTRKADADDFLATVSGSFGLTGNADTIAVIKAFGGRADAELLVRGRDIEEKELALQFDRRSCRWHVAGDSEDLKRSRARQDIIDLFRAKENKIMGPSEVAGHLGKTEASVKNLMPSMVDDGELTKEGRGQYRLPDSLS